MPTSASKLKTSLLIGVGIPAAIILSAVLLPTSVISGPVGRVANAVSTPGDSLIRSIYPWHVPRLSDLLLAILVDVVFYTLVAWIALSLPWGRLRKTTSK